MCAISTWPRLPLDLDAPPLPSRTTILRCCGPHMVCGCPRFSSALHVRSLCPPFPELEQHLIIERQKHSDHINSCHVIQQFQQSCSRAVLQKKSKRKEAAQRARAQRARPSQLTSYVRVGVDRLQHLQLLHAALLGGIGARGSEVRDAHERSFFIRSSRCRRGGRTHVFPFAVLTASGGEA